MFQSNKFHHLVIKIANSKFLKWNLVTKGSLTNKISVTDSDIPDRDPDTIDDGKTKIWILEGNHKVKLNETGTKSWWFNGDLHRDDGPAVIDNDGSKYWYKNGKQHRDDGPAVEFSNGTKKWYLNGKQHRDDGPAVEFSNGTKYWYLNGKQHREDGPAVEKVNGSVEYWLNGKQVKSKDYDSPDFKKRWQKLLELERIRQVMED